MDRMLKRRLKSSDQLLLTNFAGFSNSYKSTTLSSYHSSETIQKIKFKRSSVYMLYRPFSSTKQNISQINEKERKRRNTWNLHKNQSRKNLRGEEDKNMILRTKLMIHGIRQSYLVLAEKSKVCTFVRSDRRKQSLEHFEMPCLLLLAVGRKKSWFWNFGGCFCKGDTLFA